MARLNRVEELDKTPYIITEDSASDITFAPAAGLTSTDVQAALEELKSSVDNAATSTGLEEAIAHTQKPVYEVVSNTGSYVPSTTLGTRLLIVGATPLADANFAPLTGTAHQNEIIEKEASGYVVKFDPASSDEGAEVYNQELAGTDAETEKSGKYFFDGANWVFDSALYDDSTIGKNGSDELYVKADGITDAEIVDGAILPSKLNSSVFGALVEANGGTGAIDVKFDPLVFENSGNALFLKTSAIKNNHIDFGPSATQINAGDLPISAISGIVATDVQGALAELEATKLDLTGGTMTGDIVLSGDGTLGLHPATKNQLDALEAIVNANADGQVAKRAVDLVALSEIDVSTGGTPVIDGVTPTITMSVLLTAQTTTPTENGVWDVNAGAWTRRDDSDAIAPGAEVWAGTTYLIQAGVSEGGKKYTQINKGTGPDDAIDVGTDVQAYAVTQAQIPLATASSNGLMSSGDKNKLDTVAANAAPDQNADEVPYTGTLTATDVQAGLDELDSAKVDRAGDTMTGNLILPVGAKTGNQAVSAADLGTFVGGSGLVAKTDFDAFTVLAADTDDTPDAVTVNPSTFVGRKSSGGVVAMSATEARTELNVADGADVTNSSSVEGAGAVMEAHYGVNQVLAATTSANPQPVTVAERTILGRRTNGNIEAIAYSDLVDDLNLVPGRELIIVSALDVANGYITLPKKALPSTVEVSELGGSDQVSADEIGATSTGIITPDFQHGVAGHLDKVFFVNGSWLGGTVTISGLSPNIAFQDKLRISWMGEA